MVISENKFTPQAIEEFVHALSSDLRLQELGIAGEPLSEEVMKVLGQKQAESENLFLVGSLCLNFNGQVDRLAEVLRGMSPTAKLDELTIHGGLKYDEVEVVSLDTCFSGFSKLRFVHKKVKGAKNIQDPRFDAKHASLS